jgi:hypothetical protein
MTTLEKRIRKAIDMSRAVGDDEAYAYLPDIIKTLEKMAISINDRTITREERVRMSSGLGRLVLEEYSFAESKLGEILVGIADDFAAYIPV